MTAPHPDRMGPRQFVLLDTPDDFQLASLTGPDTERQAREQKEAEANQTNRNQLQRPLL